MLEPDLKLSDLYQDYVYDHRLRHEVFRQIQEFDFDQQSETGQQLSFAVFLPTQKHKAIGSEGWFDYMRVGEVAVKGMVFSDEIWTRDQDCRKKKQ